MTDAGHPRENDDLPGDDDGGRQEPTEPEEDLEDPLETEKIKYLFGVDAQPPLVVTVRGGPVAAFYAPAEFLAKLAERIALLLKEMGGGLTPMLYGAIPGDSMTLVFGDPDPVAAQGQLPVEITAAQAERVADLIDREGDDLFARALQIGAPVRQYDELAKLVQTQLVRLRWAVRERQPRVLSPERAQRQHARLSAPVETEDRPLTVNGVLYRVITESTREGFKGSVGIHLHSWSSRPPGDTSKKRVLAFYEDAAVEEKIKEGLVGEPIEARLLIRQAVAGASIEPESFDLVLADLEAGPREDAHLGPGFFDEGEETAL